MWRASLQTHLHLSLKNDFLLRERCEGSTAVSAQPLAPASAHQGRQCAPCSLLSSPDGDWWYWARGHGPVACPIPSTVCYGRFQKMEPGEDHPGHSLRQDGENSKRNEWGSPCRQIGGGMAPSECNLLERRGRVGRGEEEWGDVGRTRSGQQTASTATNNGRVGCKHRVVMETEQDN